MSEATMAPSNRCASVVCKLRVERAYLNKSNEAECSRRVAAIGEWESVVNL